jgi:hypothetical protein
MCVQFSELLKSFRLLISLSTGRETVDRPIEGIAVHHGDSPTTPTSSHIVQTIARTHRTASAISVTSASVLNVVPP